MVNEVLKHVSILYVEDDDEIRPIVQRGIKRRVKELFTAVDGLDGLEKFKEFKPDIVLTDIKMPKMNGIEMSKRIKEINKDIPIIIMSAHSEADFLLESIEIGIDGYLLKPVDKDKMFEKLVIAAKDVLYEQKELEHNKLIQELIDLQPSIIFSADDDNKLLFVNKAFLEFFYCGLNIEDFNHKNIPLSEFFSKFCDSRILEKEIDGQNWIDYVKTHPNENIKISFQKDDKECSFIIKEKVVEYDSGKKNMVMTLTNRWD